jgi:tRNA pseudouridine55 synthase
MSSAYALSLIKRRFKGEKIGHMGTLDPLASGVLPVAFGKSTRLFDFLPEKTKVYKANFTFSYETDTLDRGGKIIKENGLIPTREDIEKVLSSLVGSVEQLPPIYSAKNVNGKRSYELARSGVEVELKPKTVYIDSIKLTNVIDSKTYEFIIECKGGTYIRSICRDMATKLNTFATMTKLKRVKSGCFDESSAITEAELISVTNLEDLLIKPDSVLNLDIISLDNHQSIELYNGRDCVVSCSDGTYKIYDNIGIFIGVGIVQNNLLKIKAYIKD